MSGYLHHRGTINFDDLNWRTRTYQRTLAYCQSKLANILHAKELARRVESDGISVYSLHPGFVNSMLSRDIFETWYGKIFEPFARFFKWAFLLTPREGAQTSLYCCLEESIANESGKYYSGCKEAQPSSKANIVEDQKRLWEVSERLVGLKTD